MIVSLVMEAYKNKFTTTELPSYKEVLYDVATENRCAQRDLDEVESKERNCMRLARQFCLVTKEDRERFFTYVLSKPSTHLASFSPTYAIRQCWIIYSMIKR